MKWLLFFQNPNDRVTYTSDESEDRSSLSYKKFCDMIFQFPIKDSEGLKIHLDTFHTVFVNLNSYEWEVIYPEKITEYNFDEMAKLNPNEEDKQKQEKFKKNREVSLTKEYFDNIYKNKRENLFNEYRK